MKGEVPGLGRDLGALKRGRDNEVREELGTLTRSGNNELVGVLRWTIVSILYGTFKGRFSID